MGKPLYQYRYDMKTKESRERQVKDDYVYALNHKSPIADKFVELDNYYHNRHFTQKQIADLMERKNLNFIPPVIPDPYIQVESSIIPYIPDFEFKGRDDDLDSKRAKQRQQVVEYVIYNNKIDPLNTENERNLGKLGNAFWKVSWDDSITGPGFIGDIVIGNPDPANILPDPAAYDIDDCEFIIYAFRMHRRAARRRFGKIIDDIGMDNNSSDTEIYNTNDDDTSNSTVSSSGRDVTDDTVQVVEYWYKGDKGEINCSIQVNGKEVKHIQDYWRNTGCRMYPFVKYCKVPVSKSFWDKSDIEVIKDLVDAVDREFMTLILNDAFNANDITIAEENSFKDGYEPNNEPGAIWWLKSGKSNTVARLGGLTGQNANVWTTIQGIRQIIQETNGNFDSSMGKEPVRVTTASGIAQLNERADARKNQKKADRIAGFQRLFELVDWTALEFYNTDRIILIRGLNGQQDTIFTYNSDNYKQFNRNQYIQQMTAMQQKGIEITPEMEAQTAQNAFYYPNIDCEVNVGDGMLKSKSFTLQFTQELAKTPITPQNYKIIMSAVDIADLPNKQEIKDAIEGMFQPNPPTPGENPQLPGGAKSEIDMNAIVSQLSPEEIQKLRDNPEIMEQWAQSMGGVA